MNTIKSDDNTLSIPDFMIIGMAIQFNILIIILMNSSIIKDMPNNYPYTTLLLTLCLLITSTQQIETKQLPEV